MRRKAGWITLFLIAFLTAGAWAASKMVSIQVRQGQVRSNPSYLSKVVGSLAYGERVSNLGEQKDWLKVKSSKGLTGWIHVSAVTEKQIVLTSGKSRAGLKASDEELILAGKGFNSDVERKYRASNPKAAYSWVDKAEKENNLTPGQITAFLNAGGLKPLDIALKAKKPSSTRSEGGGGANVNP